MARGVKIAEVGPFDALSLGAMPFPGRLASSAVTVEGAREIEPIVKKDGWDRPKNEQLLQKNFVQQRAQEAQLIAYLPTSTIKLFTHLRT